MRLTSGLLFLAFQQGVERHTVDRVDLESDSWDVSHALAFGTADALDPDLIMFVDEVESSVARQKCRDDFSVLYQLNSDRLAYGAVWLAAFDADFLQDYASALWGSLKGVRFVIEPKHTTFVGWVVPSEALVPSFRLAGGQQTPR